MLFLMKIVKFSASIMTGLWARAGGLSLGGRRRNWEEGPPTFLGAPPDGHVGGASRGLGETLPRALALAPPREWTGPGRPEARRVPRPLRLHRVHLRRAPALDLAGPQGRAVVDAAAGEDPCEGGAAIAGCTPSSSPRPPLPIRDAPQHTQGPGRRRERPGQGGGPGPCAPQTPPSWPPQPWTGQTEGTTHPSRVPSPFTAETPSPRALSCLRALAASAPLA